MRKITTLFLLIILLFVIILTSCNSKTGTNTVNDTNTQQTDYIINKKLSQNVH